MNQELKIFGIQSVTEAILSGKSIGKVYIQKNLRGDNFFKLNKLIQEHKISCSFVPVEKLNYLSKRENHQGVVAHLSPIEFVDLEQLIETSLTEHKKPLFLLLDQISDVRNFGSIIRTAECLGVHGIIIQQQGNAPINEVVAKTSSGAVFKVPISKVAHLKDAVFQLQAASIQVVATTEKVTEPVYQCNFMKPTAIIMGSEGKGIAPSILKLVDQKASLPMLGSIKSLNVAVACGVFLYEVMRQRNETL